MTGNNEKLPPAADEINPAEVDEIVAAVGRGPEAVIPILRAIQDRYHYLPEAALRRVTETTGITPASIAGVSTFYSQFRHKPVGKHIISVCVGTACHVKGSERVGDAIRRHLKLETGEDTDGDRLFTIQEVACLGCCTLAPVLQIDGVTYGHVTPERVPQVLKDFLKQEKEGAGKKTGPAPVKDGKQSGEIRIGLGSCCIASGSSKIKDALEKALAETGVAVPVNRVGCIGMCHQTPLLEVVLPDNTSVLYSHLKPEDAREVVLRHFKPRGVMRRIGNTVPRLLEKLLTDETWAPISRQLISPRDPPVAAFLDRQKHIATEFCGTIDPTDMEEYGRRGGFKALRRCLLELTPDQIIRDIKESGLQGRGGAGFPTGQKWTFVRAAAGKKYIICNGDEGDPGAFMDRMLFESYPYRIIEGMVIAAYAVGAHEGYFYIRSEYPLALRRVREALARCEATGLIGDNILGSGFALKLFIMEGAGAFVCGEETALIASIEGKRGMPRQRPPFPAQSGLWGRPTLVNNCETYSVVPWIMRNGPAAFARMGTAGSKGTKVFSLAGKIVRGGLIEVPMGITLRQVVNDIGGGIAGGKRLKAVQIGGPSGGCVPERLADIAVDYEALTSAGAIMGSGGLVVLDETDCMVDIARYFLSFTQDQSCGKCTFCRVGTRRMLDILERLCAGGGKKGDIEELEDLALKVRRSSLCGLGKTAPNPVLSTIKYFRDEFEAHLEGRCPAKKCRALVTYAINDDCIGCTLCAQHCPVDAIAMKPYEKHEIDSEKCVRCDTCRQVCPAEAVDVLTPALHQAKIDAGKLEIKKTDA